MANLKKLVQITQTYPYVGSRNRSRPLNFQTDRLDATADRPQHDISPKGRLGPKQPLMSAQGLIPRAWSNSPGALEKKKFGVPLPTLL